MAGGRLPPVILILEYVKVNGSGYTEEFKGNFFSQIGRLHVYEVNAAGNRYVFLVFKVPVNRIDLLFTRLATGSRIYIGGAVIYPKSSYKRTV